MNVGLSNLKQLDGSSAIWDEIKEEYTDNGDTINGKIALNAGSQTAPSLYFITTTNSGLYNPTGNALGITTNGADRCHFHNNYIEPFVQFRQIDGTDSNPAYSFKNKTDSGLRWNAGSSSLVLNVNGGTVLQCKSNVTESAFPIRNLDGTTLNPYYSWVLDTDTGIYRQGNNDMRITAGNSDVCGFNSNNLTVYKPIDSTVQPTFQWVLTSNQSITASTVTDIDFVSATPTRSRGLGLTYNATTKVFTITNDTLYTGYWLVSFRFVMDAGTSGAYSIWLETGGARRMWQKLPFISTESMVLQSTDIIYFTANDTFSLKCFQNTGGSRNIANASHNGFLTLYKIS